jgi:hypothetical protein
VTPPRHLRVGLAVTTTGARSVVGLLASAEASSVRPVAVAIANQSSRSLDLPAGHYRFPVEVVESSGGVSVGRNDACRALPDGLEIVGFPNDDSSLPPHSLQAVVEAFSSAAAPDAVACAMLDPTGPRFVLPPAGELLTRKTVWRAIEPATFIRRDTFVRLGGLRTDLGTGSASPWQSGEGTDLLLRLIADGGTVLSRPDIAVLGPGERRSLSDDEFVAKHRRYARGTGYVYRLHDYPLHIRLRLLIAPLVVATRHDPSLRLSLRLATARFMGRLEGLSARPFPNHRVGMPGGGG